MHTAVVFNMVCGDVQRQRSDACYSSCHIIPLHDFQPCKDCDVVFNGLVFALRKENFLNRNGISILITPIQDANFGDPCCKIIFFSFLKIQSRQE